MSLEGFNFLITSGPTIEMWDDLRYLSNRSSGNTGYTIARKAFESGAKVKLISSVTYADTMWDNINITSADEMFQAVKNEISSADVFISAAAVADFKPKKISGKIKKTAQLPVIELERNPDILKWVGTNHKDKIIIGFSLNSHLDLEDAKRKMCEKNCDIMISNPTANLNNNNKDFSMISSGEVQEYKGINIEEMAMEILVKCQKLLKNI